MTEQFNRPQPRLDANRQIKKIPGDQHETNERRASYHPCPFRRLLRQMLSRWGVLSRLCLTSSRQKRSRIFSRERKSEGGRETTPMREKWSGVKSPKPDFVFYLRNRYRTRKEGWDTRPDTTRPEPVRTGKILFILSCFSDFEIDDSFL